MYSKPRKSRKRRKGNGVCLWSNVELLFDVVKSGVDGRKFNKLHLRVVAASKEQRALKRRGFENVDLSDVLNRENSSRKIGNAELNRTETELREAFKLASRNRSETHTIEVPRWIMERLTAGEFTVTRGVALLFYFYRRLIKTRNHFKNWIRVGEAYGRFKLEDLKSWCGIHVSRASVAIKWLRDNGFLNRAWVPYWERMKRGFCYVDGLTLKENGNNFGRWRKPVLTKAAIQRNQQRNTTKKEGVFQIVEENGVLVASRV